MSLLWSWPVRQRMLVLVFVGLLLLAGVATVIYELARAPPPPIGLSVVNGTTLGRVAGNFTDLTNTRNALVRVFVATAYANRSGWPGSAVSMNLWTETFYDSISGAVYLYANLTVSGRVALGVRPGNLQLSVNETGPLIGLDQVTAPVGVNLSFTPRQSIVLYQDGEGNLSGSFTNETASGLAYLFAFQESFKVTWRPSYNHFVGFRANIIGDFTPTIQTGILLEIVNTNGGTWA